MKPTKLIFSWINLLYLIISNSIYYKVWFVLGNSEKVIDHQNAFINKLEHNNGCSKAINGKAHYHLAQAYFRNDNLIQAIENCLTAINKYKYTSLRVYRLCAKAYRILSLNCPDFLNKIFWNREVFKEKELIN
jgi:hypothetical protein